MIACALLDSINTVKIVKITLSSLYANTARTIEDALGEAIREASRAGKAILYIPDFCSLWDALPESLQLADVVTLYKKGNVDDPGNYRPISLLQVLYKLYASLLQQHLSKGIDKSFPPENKIEITVEDVKFEKLNEFFGDSVN